MNKLHEERFQNWKQLQEPINMTVENLGNSVTNPGPNLSPTYLLGDLEQTVPPLLASVSLTVQQE